MTYQLFPIGPTEQVHEETEFNQLGQRTAKLADGGFIVAWYDARSPSIFDGADYKIRRYDSDGNPTGPERIFFDGAGDVNWNPFVTGLAGGGYAIAWQPHRDDSPFARVAIFDADDTPVATVSAPMPTPPELDGNLLGIGASGITKEWVLNPLDSGGFALTWAATATYAYFRTIFSREVWVNQEFDADGTAIGGPTMVTPWVPTAGETHARPDIIDGTPVGDGFALLMTLTPEMTGREQNSAAVQFFNADGTPAGEPVLLEPGIELRQTPRALATLEDGSLVAVWYTHGVLADGGGPKMRRLADDGTPSGDVERIEGASTNPIYLTAMDDGGWLVSWTMPTASGRAHDLRAQRYDAESNTVGDVTQIASVRSDPDRSDYGFTGFRFPFTFLTLDDGPLIGVFTGWVADMGDSDERPSYDVFIRPYAPEVMGTAQDDVLEAGAIGTALYGLDGDDTLIGGAGDDFLIGGPGDDLLLGGGGTNMAVFSGRPADYDIARAPDDRLIVTDLREGSPDGTDTLQDIALLQFAGRGDFAREIVAVGDLDLDATITGQVSTAQGQPMAGVMLTLTAEGWPDQTMTSDETGGFTFTLAKGVPGQLEATRDVMPGDSAITANDALEVLRMAVGLNPSFGPAQGQNWIAADINGDGRVDASDALDILRAAVGLDSTHAPRWVFLDSATDWAGVVQDGVVSYQQGITVDALSGAAEMGMTAILLGSLTEIA
ncbi:MAG: dockerin type I domain-containing protein [Pararhodobacter sp.]